jgi:hypothetical protein
MRLLVVASCLILSLVPAEAKKLPAVATFGLEDTDKASAPIPDVLLNGALAADEDVRSCVQNGTDFEAALFHATAIDLDRDGRMDLIIKPGEAGGCLLGANLGPWWIFRNTGAAGPGAWLPVLKASAISLSVLSEKHGKMPDLETARATATTVSTTRYRFKNGQYQ